MLKNYLKVALRNLRKQKAYSFINVTGLAIGLACFILIILFVQDEMGYDRHHTYADDIYRVIMDIQTSDGLQQTAQSPSAWGPTLVNDFPEVVSAVRMKPPNQMWMVGRDNKQFYEKGVAFSDSSVFDVFTIPLVRGNPEVALDAPFKMVISEAMAQKYFPGEDAMGQTIALDSQYDFEVTGIMQDMPNRGHFNFGFLPSISTLAQVPIYNNTEFLDLQFPVLYTYIRLEEGFPAAILEEKFPAFIQKYVAAQFPFEEAGFEVNAFLQPLTDIHLHSQRESEIGPNGNIAIVYTFLAIAFFILLIASINFMNLATARSASRAKEVGMRKAVGAQRGQVILQFLGESTLLGLMALLLAIGLVWLALPEFSTITGKSISSASLFNPVFLLSLIGLATLVGVLSGSYPAFFLSAFRPATVLKGTLTSGTAGQNWLRKGLIIFQFGISIALIISTGIVYNQMEYVRNKNLGFDKEHVAVIQLTDPTPRTLYQAYKRMILNDPNVLSVSASSSAPASLVNTATMRPVAANQDENWLMQAYFSDFDLVETLNMELLAGRTHSLDFPSDTLASFFQPNDPNETITSSIILNEKAAQDFGWNDPAQAIGQEVQFTGNTNLLFQVVGVVKDFHSQSAHEQIAPTMIMWANPQAYFYIFVRIAPGTIPETIASLEQAWNTVMPNYAFDFSFLDDTFDGQYRADVLVGTLLGYFALLTIFIACLGLFGLASFTAEQRTKEIGVRKSLGASVPSIVLLLSREFTKLVLIAFVVAAPIAYFAMRHWLNDFAYHTTIGLWTFLLAGALALLIAWGTIGYQSIKAALTDPVRALRYE